MLFTNRGMFLEYIINYTIEKYKEDKKSLIFKNSIPYLLKENKYYFLNKGTVDYHGVYKGKYLCFEAKSANKDYLPWENIKKHQWEFLILAQELNAISFIIIYFEKYESYYLVFIKKLTSLKKMEK